MFYIFIAIFCKRLQNYIDKRIDLLNNQNKHQTITIYDVAEEAGYSYSTVSRVLNGYEFVKESTREKVLRAADKLGYVANLQARSLAGGRSNIVGLLVPGLDNGYIGEIARGIDDELSKSGYNLMLYTTHRHRGKESDYVNTIANGLAAGLLLIVPLVSSSYRNILHDKQFPHVLIDQSDDTGKSSRVTSTNWQGMYDATNYLIALGHRRIGFITGLMEIQSACERLDGYKAALSDHNIEISNDLIVEGDFWEARAIEASKQLLDLDDMPTAIIGSNDLSAFSAMQVARGRGLEIPDDLSILGFDDIPQARIVHPQLTTVRQPLDHMGRVAVQMLLERIEKPALSPKTITLGTKLIERSSCAKPHHLR